MERSAEFDFALDIDDLAAAGPHLAGDAGGPPKGKSAEFGDAQAIDLADMDSRGVDQRHLFEDGFLCPVAQAGGALDAGAQGTIHIGSRDHVAFGLTGTKIRLDQDLPQLLYDQ